MADRDAKTLILRDASTVEQAKGWGACRPMGSKPRAVGGAAAAAALCG
jgi:hypothetical protein